MTPHNKPKKYFLRKIRIAHLPEDVDLSFDDRTGHLTYIPGPDKTVTGAAWESRRAFNIARLDETGTPLKKTVIPAFETPTRTKEDILADLHAALVREYNAVSSLKAVVAAQRPNRPSPEFLKSIQITHLPYDVDITFSNTEVDCARAFNIHRVAGKTSHRS